MKIVIAPDSYKESLSALEVARQIESGFREFFPDAEILIFPMADGGEGTVEAMVTSTCGRRVGAAVTDPIGGKVTAYYGITGDGQSAVIEMAAASGLALVPSAQRNPLKTTSRGTGELISEALGLGMKRLILGIGGSATNDGGAGMLQALGARLLDRGGREVAHGGSALLGLHTIDLSDLDPRLREIDIEVACDVDNPLTGPKGASAVFGPQKGATPEMIEILDRALSHFAGVIRRQFGIDVAPIPGAGAAGGMGAALLAFFNVRLRPGIEIVIEAAGLEDALRDADLVITGEGRIDSQTLCGKTPIGVARLAKHHGKPVIAIAGSLAPDAGAVHAHGIDAIFSSVSRICSMEEALDGAAENLRLTSRNIAAAIRLGSLMT
jgi:glycerate 2-kinase